MSDDRRVAIVSGGSRGLGQAIVEDLLKQGMTVAAFSRSATRFTEERQAADPKGESFYWEAIDGSDFPRLGEFVRGVLRRYERVDALVNNMATMSEGLLALMRDADIHRQVAMNLEAAIYLTRACLKGMLPQAAGSIVNIASVNALRGHTGVAVYSATKAAMVGLTKSLAVEVGPGGIRVNCVAPGYFQSEMTSGFSDEQLARIARRTPLRRLGTVEDIVAAIRFFLSPQAAFITGQMIAVDGGFTS
ncbi:MAG: SDR family oxidoreductase [Planctomycetaceae bacterium]|nr:SDR family oxidoreductase [Planctomycetaceae bacterium]